MGTRVIDVPGGINLAAFYYPEVLREILLFLRANKEQIGLTDENEFEVHVQLMRAFSLMAHLNNTRLDTVATEMFIDSAQLLGSVKRLLRLVGVELSSATPAVADILAKLGEVTVLDQVGFVPGLAEFETSDVPPIGYEASEDGIDLDRTDQVKHIYSLNKTEVSSGATLASVASGSDVITRASGAWAADAVGQEIFFDVSPAGNQGNIGRYRVISRIDDDRIRVVRVPGSKEPGFQTEAGISWVLREYSVDFAPSAIGVGLWLPFNDPVSNGEALYLAHNQMMMTQLDFNFSSSFTDGFNGVWEYHDDERSLFNPTGVKDNGSTLTFDLTALMTYEDGKGALITVTFAKTGAKEVLVGLFGIVAGLGGGANINYVTTAGLLGQIIASEETDDYLITSDWVPVPNAVDNTIQSTSDLINDGSVTWDLPQDSERSWLSTDINLITAMWLRFRIVNRIGSNVPLFDTIDIDQGDQYLMFPVTQGNTIGPQIIGSSTGAASQEFVLPGTPYIDDTDLIEVDEGGAGTFLEWERVLSFLNSGATDRDYVLEADENDQATVKFGSGVNGKIPPAGANNVRSTHRVGGDVNGSVGADQITVNAEGVTGITIVTNPRPAYGWRLKDGGDAADLERVKRDKPAEVRVRGTATTAPDTKRLAVEEFIDSDGVKPIERAEAFEEAFGVKTVKLMVVGLGGNILTATQLEEVNTYFNGDRYAQPPVKGVLVMNHQLTTVNYEPAIITVEANVVWPGGSAEVIRNSLLVFLNPLTVDTDGTTYIWDFGTQVSLSRIYNLIHETDPGIRDVPVLKLANGGGTPAAVSVSLSANELPVAKAATISISILEA